MSDLPPSLQAVPNIPFEAQTVEQLLLERAYWQARINAATQWGAAYKFALDSVKACDAWIKRREGK